MNKTQDIEFHEYANLFPMMDDDAFAELSADIKKNGLLESISLYEEKILDGRNRYKACIEAGIKPKFQQLNGKTDPLQYVISKNLKRRHLNTGQRAVLATRLANMMVGGDRKSNHSANLRNDKVSQAEAAEIMNVSERTVNEVAAIEKAAPELVEKILEGKITVNQATKKIKNDQALEDFKEQTKSQSVITAIVEVSDCQTWIAGKPDCDLLLTDPPYSTDIDVPIVQFATWLPLALKKVKDTGRAYVFIGAYPEELAAYLTQKYPSHICLEQVLIWEYKNTLGQNPEYTYKQNYQACLYFVGVNAPPLDCPITNEQWAVIHKNAPDGRIGDRFHTWQKPIEIAEMFIRHSTKPENIVYDPFTCTGTFLLAAAKLGRRGFGCDISRENLEIAIERGCQYA